MRRVYILILYVLFTEFTGLRVFSQEINLANVEITSQSDGEVVQGTVPIIGNTKTDDFTSWEISFGYVEDTTGTWFLLKESDVPVEGNLLTVWDTTIFTDGIYNLRLTVNLVEGRQTHYIIRDLRVRNYTPIETSTPDVTQIPFQLTSTLEASQTPALVNLPTHTNQPSTHTPFPTNPVELTGTEISFNFIQGIAGAFAGFIIIGFYFTVRKVLKKS